MEMDLGSASGVVFDAVLQFFVISLSSWGIFIWLFNRNKWDKYGTLIVLRQSLARSWLDTGLIAGILGVSIGVMGLMAGSPETPDLDFLYSVMPILLNTFLWGGLLTGLGYCLLNEHVQLDLRIKATHLAAAVFMGSFPLIYLAEDSRLSLLSFFTNPHSLIYYLTPFSLIVIVGWKTKRLILALLADANLVATLGGMAIGVSFWFVEGADFEASTDAIYFIANILMFGCLSYLVIYLVSLLLNISSECNYQTKSWHFAEASAFFVFLVFAPVGATEYAREWTDLATLQTQHEAQQLEINQLKAQIKLLTEKVGEV